MPMREPWCVAVTRDEPANGPLSTALRHAGLQVMPCPVVTELPPVDSAPLVRAVADLETFDWAIFSSGRAVRAVSRVRGDAWPALLRTAAVGPSTAAALRENGIAIEPVVSGESGADALWQVLKNEPWRDTRVLLPVVEGGRQTIIDGLKNAGALITIIEAYRMVPRPAKEIAADWAAAKPDAVVMASPSAVNTLIDAIGSDAIASLSAVVAIGPTTAAAADARGLKVIVSPAADFDAVARVVVERAAADRIAHADG